MTPKAKIVDIDPVKRPGGCRRLIVPLLFLIAAGLVAYRFLVPVKRPILPRAVEVTDVRSTIEQQGESLRVVVDWRLVLPRGPELAESTRVEVGVDNGAESQVATVDPKSLIADPRGRNVYRAASARSNARRARAATS